MSFLIDIHRDDDIGFPATATGGPAALISAASGMASNTFRRWTGLNDTLIFDTIRTTDNEANSLNVRGATGSIAVVIAWCSASYDWDREELLLFGGGHNDYGGNEVYKLSLETGQGERLFLPRAQETWAKFVVNSPVSGDNITFNVPSASYRTYRAGTEFAIGGSDADTAANLAAAITSNQPAGFRAVQALDYSGNPTNVVNLYLNRTYDGTNSYRGSGNVTLSASLAPDGNATNYAIGKFFDHRPETYPSARFHNTHGDPNYCSDGPPAMHVYQGFCYVPTRNSHVTVGGSVYQHGAGPTRIATCHPLNGYKWRTYAHLPLGTNTVTFPHALAWNDRLWMVDYGSGGFETLYSVDTSPISWPEGTWSWTNHYTSPSSFELDNRGICKGIVNSTDVAFRVGTTGSQTYQRALVAYKLATSGVTETLLAKSPPAGYPQTYGMGIDYRPAPDHDLFMWDGNGNVLRFDLTDFEANGARDQNWSWLTPGGDGPPATYLSGGVMGNWRYIAAAGVFIGITSWTPTNGGIWIYKP